MESKDAIKVLMLIVLYLGVTPLLGWAIKGKRKGQQIVFFILCFMTISGLLHGAEWSFNLAYEEDYRGHARGYQFFFQIVPAGALILASFLENPRRFRWFPPGLMLYLSYLGLCFISIINAPQPHYTFTAMLRSVEVTVIFIGAYCFFKSVEDVRFLLTAFTWTVLWELFVVLKSKYIDQQYQIFGTFEHQNALSMYATMIGMVLLGGAVAPKQPRSKFYLAGFIACAWIVECTLSRGGLAAFAIGTVGMMGLSLMDKITTRRVLITGVLAVVGAVGIVLSLNTLIDRFNSPYNADSKQTRVMLNQASRDMVRDYPLGVGLNNFGAMINPPYPYGNIIDDYFKRYGDWKETDKNKGIVESLYWLTIAETGWQGIASFLLVMFYFLWRNWQAMRCFRNNLLGSVSLGIAMGCTSNYLQSFLERVLTQPRNLMLWMVLLAVTSRIEAWRVEARRKRRRRPEPMQVEAPSIQASA